MCLLFVRKYRPRTHGLLHMRRINLFICVRYQEIATSNPAPLLPDPSGQQGSPESGSDHRRGLPPVLKEEETAHTPGEAQEGRGLR